MKNKYTNHLTAVHSILSFGLMAMLFAIFSSVASAQAVRHQSDFNHMSTGFPLTGSHVRVECETCHTGGVFKGTPKDCAGCHSLGRRVIAPVKPTNHMDTSAPCDTCHTNTVTFIGARFNHMGVQPKACMTCHTGIHAPGKPSGHVVTMSSCDSCHRTSSWIPAGFNHTGTFLVCANCHNGVNAIGKPGFHVPTATPCDSCHKSGFTTFAGAVYDHVGVVAGQCGTCHIPGTYRAKTKPAGHIPYTGNDCDSCHVGTGYISFAGSTMNHTVVGGASAVCINCHNGSYTSQGAFLGGAKAKTPNHVVSANTCNDCHKSFNTFLGGLYTHNPATVTGICQTCHNGVNALGKTSTVTHNGTSASCDTCHGNANTYTSFAGAAFNHVGVVAGTCGTCHLGQSASVKTKSQTHIPTTGNACDACHLNTTSFLSPTMNHTAVASISCSTCHNGAYLSEGTTGALAKTPTHIATSATCNSCHHSFTTFMGVVYDHSGVTPTTCGTCHISGAGGAKTTSFRATHVLVTAAGNACDACHKTGYTSFQGAVMNHAAVTAARCDSCHDGSHDAEGVLGAWGKVHVSNHVLTSLDCKTCHIGTTSWVHPPEKMDHISNSNTVTCNECHGSTAIFAGDMRKMPLGTTSGPSEHQSAPATKNCSNSGCHRPLGSKGSLYSTWN